eukprot:CAMPEP_0197025130 /NCGR_PEP_ID=MMETSP1384-20130603/5553_1 /TAXON_ID=29189 /ORGANISM="Ammonia sp." /LENGTH=304 /DNA_ID=CAMNT_0042453621 /DNA_START=80 /DNA_END=994 /DNA_ORIENTATION=+
MCHSYTDGALYRQNFEDDANIEDWYLSEPDILLYDYGSYGQIIKVSYIPTDDGSERVGTRFALQAGASEVTLSFDVKLHSAFEFVRGGKMHGVAGGTATTGCKPIDADGWSVRMMWGSAGDPRLYIYHQDRKSSCGDPYFQSQSQFTFALGTWYRVEIYVKLNSNANSFDGEAALYIDGDLLVEVQNLRLSGNNDNDIDWFDFSTFYGGSDQSWSPSTTTLAYYDNFTVHSGKKVSGRNGKECEVYKKGIFHTAAQACCAVECGSCGGTGCSSLAGGSSACCTGVILANDDRCASGLDAPCSYS